MDEQIFFIIDGKELVLDKILVEFNEMPIFFVCKSDQIYFISLCVDMENERYLLASVGLRDLSKMLHGKITMRNFILQASEFWDITAGASISEDIVIEKSVESILLDELPYEGEYLTLATKDLKIYTEKIDAMLYDGGIWENKVSQICDEYSCIFEETLIKSYERLTVQSVYNVYKGIIGDINKTNFNDVITDNYSKEIYNSKLKDIDLGIKFEIKISDNSKRSLAA